MTRQLLAFCIFHFLAACVPQATTAPTTAAARAVAPYYYLGWGEPPDVRVVMQATGLKWFTLAFVIDAGGCEPRWDAERALDDARDLALIQGIRAQGGDVMVSFGGEQGRTLELHCPSSEALAAAYEKVIAAYALTAIDVDFEGGSYRDVSAQERVVAALLAVRARHPQLGIYLTLPTGPAGPDNAVIMRAARAGLAVDGWSIMTFDWGDTSERQAELTMQATDALKESLIAAYGFSEREAYGHAGISAMNGRSDERGLFTLADMRAVTAYAKKHQLARLTFWSVNRDRPCPEESAAVARCSGVAQDNWDYTRAIADFLR